MDDAHGLTEVNDDKECSLIIDNACGPTEVKGAQSDEEQRTWTDNGQRSAVR